MEIGRGDIRDFRVLAERAVVALEKMGDDPIVEMEMGPPVCPHCNKLNPIVTTPSQDESTGKMFEFYVNFHCEECGANFSGVPIQWSMHLSQETLVAEIEGRAEADAAFNGNS